VQLKKPGKLAAAGAQAAGAEVTLLDLRDFPMPIYDGDLEDSEGLPAKALGLRRIMLAHQGLLIASPEYNSSLSPLPKNTIDWLSRPVDGEPGLLPFRDKVAALMAASPGALGGLRGLVHLRAILGNIGVIVLPAQVAIGKAHEAFDDRGALVDPQQAAAIDARGVNVATIATKLRA